MAAPALQAVASSDFRGSTQAASDNAVGQYSELERSSAPRQKSRQQSSLCEGADEKALTVCRLLESDLVAVYL